MELLAHGEEVHHECRPDLTADEAHCLEEPAKRQAIDRAAEETAVTLLRLRDAGDGIFATKISRIGPELSPPANRAGDALGYPL